MTIETDIVDAIEDLFAGGAWHDTAPEDPTYPYVTLQQVGGAPNDSLCGDCDVQNARIQFNVWSRDGRVAANTLMRSLAARVTAAPLRAVSLGGAVSRDGTPTRSFGTQQDFSFWFRP